MDDVSSYCIATGLADASIRSDNEHAGDFQVPKFEEYSSSIGHGIVNSLEAIYK